jgi:hypothetical protein
VATTPRTIVRRRHGNDNSPALIGSSNEISGGGTGLLFGDYWHPWRGYSIDFARPSPVKQQSLPISVAAGERSLPWLRVWRSPPPCAPVPAQGEARLDMRQIGNANRQCDLHNTKNSQKALLILTGAICHVGRRSLSVRLSGERFGPTLSSSKSGPVTAIPHYAQRSS